MPASKRPECSDEVVRTPSGNLPVHVWMPPEGDMPELTVVTVHPWATLGGGEHNCLGIAQILASSGVRVLSFDMGSSWMVWGVLSAHSKEVGQIKAVCAHAQERWGGRVVLFGSSAGGPMAGSAFAAASVEALVTVGYTWGFPASIAFGRHFRALLSSPKPKLLIQGANDEFTSVPTLERMVARATGSNKVVVVPDVGHFELESPAFDAKVAELTLLWLQELGLAAE